MQSGTHLIIDLERCNTRLDYVHVVEDFIMKLNSEVLKMNVLSGPHTNYLVNNDDPMKNGVTSIMGIDTSHIAIHTFTKFDELKNYWGKLMIFGSLGGVEAGTFTGRWASFTRIAGEKQLAGKKERKI